MRRHATASSTRSKARKPSGQGTPPSGRLRLTILLATVAALLLLPVAAQAAEGPGTVHVLVEGTGSGTVSSVGGYEGSGFYEGGPPPIECSGPPATGVCKTHLADEGEEIEAIVLTSTADPGSEFVGMEVSNKHELGGKGSCQAESTCIPFFNPGEGGGEITVTALFEEEESATTFPLTVSKTGAGSGTVTSSPAGINCGSECSAAFGEGSKVKLSAAASAGSEFREWSGACSGAGSCEVTMSEAKSVTARFSHVRQVLTVTKSGSGLGTVSSKPKGVKCAANCSLAKARLYKGTKVVLTATAFSGSTFTEWTGACSGSGTCEVEMNEAKSVGAKFGGASKEVVNPKVLTLAKATGTGTGTVKASGLTCEAACTETAVAYFGGVTEPKPKAAATVTLVAIPAVDSSFSGWSGCGSNPTPSECVVSTSAAKSVTAQFSALPTKVLTVTKSGSGLGTVSSKPKGVKCAANCSSATAALPQGTKVVLTATAFSGSTFTEWTGACSGSGACEVEMSEAKSVGAKFGGASKEVVNPKVLTLSKAGTGYGTVKASGLTCEAACTSTAVAYFGGVTEPKPKAAATVTLVAIPQAGSELTGWTGCASNPSATECVVSMSAAKSVTARFEE